MSGPLQGIKVLDVGVMGVGPFATCLLGAMGADVIRIEPPHLDTLVRVPEPTVGGVGSCYITTHLNQKNIILNMRKDEEREIGLELAKWADVIIENHLPGTMEKLGFGYDDIAKINPRVVYVSSTAYGREGPLSQLGGADHYIQPASGFAYLNGKEGGDPEILRHATHIDQVNSLSCCQAALMGLLARNRTGKGQHIETSSFQGAILLQASRLAEFFATGKEPPRLGSASSTIVPSQAFKTWDKRYINVSVPREEYWSKLCKALELDKIEKDPKFKTNAERLKNRSELVKILQEKIGDKPARWWIVHLRRNGVPCGLNYTYDDLCGDPHIQQQKMVVDVKSPWGIMKHGNLPWKFSETPLNKISPTPRPDQNRKEILEMLGRKKSAGK